MVFIWSGQHYSDNLKDIFFRELDVAAGRDRTRLRRRHRCRGRRLGRLAALSRARGAAAGGRRLPRRHEHHTGALAAAQLNIPIVHIEGCMRSYDWRMPEEKYRTTIDHLADVIYTYFDEYKEQGVREGLNPAQHRRGRQPDRRHPQSLLLLRKATSTTRWRRRTFFAARGIERAKYYLMTCHRRENVHIRIVLRRSSTSSAQAPDPVYFPASYRTQKVLRELGLTVPPQRPMVDPIGYEEMLCLMVNSRGVITDSGTVVEETCVLQCRRCRCASRPSGRRSMTWARA